MIVTNHKVIIRIHLKTDYCFKGIDTCLSFVRCIVYNMIIAEH